MSKKTFYKVDLYVPDLSSENKDVKKDYSYKDNLELADYKKIDELIVYKSLNGKYREIITGKIIPSKKEKARTLIIVSMIYDFDRAGKLYTKYDYSNPAHFICTEDAFLNSFYDSYTHNHIDSLAVTESEVKEYLEYHLDMNNYEVTDNINYKKAEDLWLDKLNLIFEQAKKDLLTIIEESEFSDEYVANSKLSNLGKVKYKKKKKKKYEIKWI